MPSSLRHADDVRLLGGAVPHSNDGGNADATLSWDSTVRFLAASIPDTPPVKFHDGIS